MIDLIVIPTQIELKPFLEKLHSSNYDDEVISIKDKNVYYFDELKIIVAAGGLGKVQFGIQTQFYIDNIEDVRTVICAGAAGNLVESNNCGDIVIGEKTIEYDIERHSSDLIPEYNGDENIIEVIKKIDKSKKKYKVHYGSIASGDKDITDHASRKKVIERTNAIAVAWEGAGGAKASKYNKVPFIEIRGLTDDANESTRTDFHSNIKIVMENLADIVIEISKDK